MDVFVAGGCSYNSMGYLDEFPQETETHRARNFQETVGSTGAGKTLNLGRLGMNVTFHAMIGADRYGEVIEETFASEPVTFISDVDPNGTERHINLMNAHGERISIVVVESTPEPDIDYDRLDALGWPGSRFLGTRTFCAFGRLAGCRIPNSLRGQSVTGLSGVHRAVG